tara:strand:- start:276 stop:566 length:291 start_codon:yes stop_codon:yes gene_type:complete
MTRPYLGHEAWESASKDNLTPAPLIMYKGQRAVSDECHEEMWAGPEGSLYTGNLWIIDSKEVIYGHKYTDKDFVKWTLIPLELDNYLRRSSFGVSQ